MSEQEAIAKWVNDLAGDYVESWVGDMVAEAWIKDKRRIAALEAAGEEMANNLATLANHLRGRIGEGAQAEMLRLAAEWYELVPETAK